MNFFFRYLSAKQGAHLARGRLVPPTTTMETVGKARRSKSSAGPMPLWS